MKRGVVFLLVTALALGAGALASRLPDALSRMEVFRVTEILVEGNRFLSRTEAVMAAAVPDQASLWEDRDPWTAGLLAHPLVREARIRRRLPGTLILEVVEREPVALVSNPTLEPVDEAGRLLPVDPAEHRLDLPIITAWGGGDLATLSPSERGVLAGEIARMAEADPEILARISELSLGRRGDLRARIWEPEVTLFYRPGIPGRRIREGLRVLADAGARFEEREAMDLDLRWEDQVVVQLSRPKGS